MREPICLADLWGNDPGVVGDLIIEAGIVAEALGDGLADLAPGVLDKFEHAISLVESWGVRVIRLEGYQDRGRPSTFEPRGCVDHHTGGPAWATEAQTWSITYLCRDGRSDLNGPLSNVVTWADGTLVVVAAGTCNHAGPGGRNGLSGNYSVLGNEQVHSGGPNEPWPEAQLRTALLWNAACAISFGFGADMACEHKEWSTAGKPDRINIDGDERRAALAALLAEGPDKEDGLTEDQANTLRFIAQVVSELKRPFEAAGDGDFFKGLEKFERLLRGAGGGSTTTVAGGTGTFTISGSGSLKVE